MQTQQHQVSPCDLDLRTLKVLP